MENSTALHKSLTEEYEYEDDAEDYEWEYSEEEEVEENKEETNRNEETLEILNNSSSPSIIEVETAEIPSNHNDSIRLEKEQREEETKQKKKRSRHLERMEVFNKKKENGAHEESSRRKKIHVRSKDPSRIAKQFEREAKEIYKTKHRGGKLGAPPPVKVNQICKICNKEPYLVERIVAEKSWWHKNCFRCHQCNKVLSLDTYMSHESIIYCKPHHKELFQPKVVTKDIINVENANFTHEAILRHQEQSRRNETIIRENVPVQLENVVKCNSDDQKYSGLERLDVGSKFKLFENGGAEVKSSDRYGILEKLKRLQEGADLEDLLAEIEQELPSDSDETPEEAGMTNVQKKMHYAEKFFEDGDKRNKLAEERRQELKSLRKKLTGGNRENILETFEDLLISDKHSKIKKTKVDVRSENAKKFRDMFDKGEVPEGTILEDRYTLEKYQELEQMRKGKKEQRDYFKQMEEGKLEDKTIKPKLLVGKIKDTINDTEGELNSLDPESKSLSNKFTFFEHFEEKQEEAKRAKGPFGLSPLLSGQEELNEFNAVEQGSPIGLSERALARRDCKAKSILNKFKELERKAAAAAGDSHGGYGGHEELRRDDLDRPVMTALGFLGRLPGIGERPRLKKFTPPRKVRMDGSESETEYSDSDCSYSYTGSSSYTESESDSEDNMDETLRAYKAAARAKELRAKFEEWEGSQDAQEQMKQMVLHEENGGCETIGTASHLRAKFENLHLKDQDCAQPRQRPFRVQRFK